MIECKRLARGQSSAQRSCACRHRSISQKRTSIRTTCEDATLFFHLFLLLSDLCSSKPSFRSVSKFEQIAWGWMVEVEVLTLANPRGRMFRVRKCEAKDASTSGLADCYWTVSVTEVE
jgi:hypothetical protein